MDIEDEAQMRSAHFHKLAMANRVYDAAPLPPQRTDDQGNPLCIDCDLDITARRHALPHAQRCIECQQDEDKRKRNG